MTFTDKELVTAVVGFVLGVVAGGVMTWMFTNSLESRAELEALKLAHTEIVQLKSDVKDAREILQKAQDEADNLTIEVTHGRGEVTKFKSEAAKALKDLESELASRATIDGSDLDELKVVAENAAKEAATEQRLNILVGSVTWSDDMQPRRHPADSGYEIQSLTEKKLLIRFAPRNGVIPTVIATSKNGNYDTFVQIVEQAADYFTPQAFTVTDGRRVPVPASMDFVAIFRNTPG